MGLVENNQASVREPSLNAIALDYPQVGSKYKRWAPTLVNTSTNTSLDIELMHSILIECIGVTGQTISCHSISRFYFSEFVTSTFKCPYHIQLASALFHSWTSNTCDGNRQSPMILLVRIKLELLNMNYWKLFFVRSFCPNAHYI